MSLLLLDLILLNFVFDILWAVFKHDGLRSALDQVKQTASEARKNKYVHNLNLTVFVIFWILGENTANFHTGPRREPVNSRVLLWSLFFDIFRADNWKLSLLVCYRFKQLFSMCEDKDSRKRTTRASILAANRAASSSSESEEVS